MDENNFLLWCTYVIFSTFMVAILLSFASIAHAAQPKKLSNKEIQKKLDEANEREESKPIPITGFASGGKVGGIIAILIGIIMIIVTQITTAGTLQLTLGAKCKIGSLGFLPCWPLFVVGIILIIAGIMLMAKANEVKDGKREEKDNWQNLQGGVGNQAQMNQRDNLRNTNSTLF